MPRKTMVISPWSQFKPRQLANMIGVDLAGPAAAACAMRTALIGPRERRRMDRSVPILPRPHSFGKGSAGEDGEGGALTGKYCRPANAS
jgi:hypothetical protein